MEMPEALACEPIFPREAAILEAETKAKAPEVPAPATAFPFDTLSGIEEADLCSRMKATSVFSEETETFSIEEDAPCFLLALEVTVSVFDFNFIGRLDLTPGLALTSVVSLILWERPRCFCLWPALLLSRL